MPRSRSSSRTFAPRGGGASSTADLGCLRGAAGRAADHLRCPRLVSRDHRPRDRRPRGPRDARAHAGARRPRARDAQRPGARADRDGRLHGGGGGRLRTAARIGEQHRRPAGLPDPARPRHALQLPQPARQGDRDRHAHPPPRGGAGRPGDAGGRLPAARQWPFVRQPGRRRLRGPRDGHRDRRSHPPRRAPRQAGSGPAGRDTHRDVAPDLVGGAARHVHGPLPTCGRVRGGARPSVLAGIRTLPRGAPATVAVRAGAGS